MPFGTAPEAGFLDEGHVGVSLFMTLSGYLFSKLLCGKEISIGPFLWNRCLRLMPLLALVLLIVGIRHHLNGRDTADYLAGLGLGLIAPTLPNGGWSITTEMHFYLLLPILLVFVRKWSISLLIFAAFAFAYRLFLHLNGADIQYLSYLTIIGRVDQFLLGMFAFHHREAITGRFAAIVAILFLCSYSLFDMAGGYYHLPDKAKLLWVALPLWEAICLASLIAWYDRNPLPDGRISRALQKAGDYSYSIYLLHFFFYAAAARLVHVHVMDISNFYLALPWALIFFSLMAILGHFSFKYFEKPFLAFRRPYLINEQQGIEAEKPAVAA